MSWIHGYFGLRHDAHEARISRVLTADSAIESEADGFHISATGRHPTMLSSLHPEGKARDFGWIVAGLAMKSVNRSLTLLSEEEWNRRLSVDEPDLADLDGHFVAVRWREGRLDVFNDALGLRTLFFAHRHSWVCFSTRLEWIGAVMQDAVLDFETLGAQWHGRAEFGSKAPLKGVVRLGQGATGSVGSNGVQIRNRPFSAANGERVSSVEALLTAANPSIPGFETRSLACSGGLDSRVQLACLIQNADALRLHSYGPDVHPDAVISNQISRVTGLSLDRVDDPDYAPGLADVQRYATAVHAYAPASTVVDWPHYSLLEKNRRVVLDASLGEAGRCFFYRRMRSGAGQRALRDRSAKTVAQIQRQPRPDVFSRAIESVMTEGHEAAVELALSELPSDARLDDLADLLMLRLEGPRYAGYAATHIDSMATGYFPFAQPSVLRSILAVDPARRRLGGLYRNLVKELAPYLAGIPLVRNGPVVSEHPFVLSGRKAGAWTRARGLLGLGWRDRRAGKFLRGLEVDVRDLARSESTRQFEGYDYAALVELVDGFYEGRHGDAAGVDRWLSFELWRLGIQGRMF